LNDRITLLSGRFKHLAALGALALIAFLSLALSTRDWTPLADETQYLNAAYNLIHHGVLSPSGAGGPLTPSARREPGYPVFIAAFMLLDPGLAKFTPACNAPPDAKCAPYYRSLQYANSFLIVLTGILLFSTVRIVTGRTPPAYIAALLIFLNVEANEIRQEVLSDYLAMAIAAAVMRCFALAFLRPWRVGWLLTGLALAALSLPKAVYFYFTVPLLIVASAVALITIGYATPVGAWMARNFVELDSFALTETRMVLSEREIFNDMTPGEYAIAFLWWTRAMGDNLARTHLPPTSYRRFQEHAKDGFYNDSHARYSRLVAEEMRKPGVTSAQATTAVDRQLIRKILTNLPVHLLTTLPLFYRGIWVDEFIVLTLPALFWLIWVSVGRRDTLILALLAPGVFSLLFYALVSINIPRYQLTALPTLAFAGGIAGALLIERWRKRKRRSES
jgi:hypothetical protein